MEREGDRESLVLEVQHLSVSSLTKAHVTTDQMSLNFIPAEMKGGAVGEKEQKRE